MLGFLVISILSLSVDLQWVEVDVSLWQDGRADFVYKVRYDVLSGEMHGFYLQGLSVEPYFDYDNSHAVDEHGRQYALDIRDLGSKYDVLLARGQAFGPGVITFVVHFGGDLGQSGNLAATTSEYGELVVLNWSPPQWDEPLEHYTVYVYYPITVMQEEVNPDDYGFKTERFMNERYLMSYFGQEYQGEYFFTVRIHRNNIAAREKMLIQQYVPADYFQTERFGKVEITPERKKKFSFPYELLYMVLYVVPYLFYSNRKARRMKGAYSEVAGLQWLKKDWIPPKIEVATFRKSGKVAKLHLIEAAFLLDYSVNKILTILANKLEQNGVIQFTSRKPLIMKVLKRPTSLRYYESAFLDA
ncbi:MAG: hypothetical protein PVH23_03605, partial [candidate division WOR-3 bacterium]